MITLLPYQGIWPQIDPQAFIAPTAVIIGDVHIGAYSGIWYGCVVRGDVHQIRIGSYTNVQDGTVIHVTQGGQGTHIGDHITIGHMSLIHDCTLESGCFVGMKAGVMDYARVESGAMVAAGALVTPRKIVPKGQLWSGRPARYHRDLTQQDLDYFPESAKHYAELAKQYQTMYQSGKENRSLK